MRNRRVKIFDLLVVAEVVDGGGHHTHIENGTSGSIKAGSKVVSEYGRVGTCIVSDGDDLLSAYFSSEIIADEFYALFIEFFFVDASDVVFAEDGSFYKWVVGSG